MKNSKLKLVLTALTIFALLLTSACGKSGNSNSPSNESTKSSEATTAQTASDQAPTSADPFEKYNPAVEIDAVHEGMDADAKFEGGETPEDNIWTRAILDDLGIKLKYRWTCSYDKFLEKMNLTIASGDLPEFFAVNRTQYDQLVSAGLLADLTDAYAKYGSQYLKEKVVEGDGGVTLNSLKKDGKIYGIPGYLDYTEYASMVWIRTDWLKKLNLPEPKTAQDLFNIAEAFTTRDPDGNGKADTYGIPMNRDGIGNAYWNMFHSYPAIGGSVVGPVGDHGFWLKDSSGKLMDGMYGSSEQIAATKAALLKLQELYKKGIISKEFGTMDGNKQLEEEVAGKCGIAFGNLWDPWWPLQQQKTKDPSVEWKPFPIMSIDDKSALMNCEPFNMFFIYVMRKDTKHPEALIKLANYNAKWSAEPDFYIKKTGDPKANDKYTALNAFKYPPLTVYTARPNYTMYLHITKALKDKSDAGLNNSEKATYKQILDYYNGKVEFWQVERSYAQEGCEAINDYYLKNNIFLLNQYYGAPTKSMIEKGPIINKLWSEMQIKVIMGADISEFDKFVEKAKTLGADAVTQEVNDWYSAQSK